MTSLQVVIFGLGFASWLIGGNILVATHYRRVGKPWWSGFKPFAFPFNDFNAREWLVLLGLLAVSLFLFALGSGFD
ncbi:hypothetical protein ACFPPA_04550 [Rhodanobacter ginsengisoli]|uniref:Uncharacterized protein n=1 Tax=Rhodanobacter ginsengisoli TaxID=418646 RepID=A0ABW0QL68_9GAMM